MRIFQRDVMAYAHIGLRRVEKSGGQGCKQMEPPKKHERQESCWE